MDTTNEIAEFLTSRRARITPEQAGLPTYGKRRVPGLRREEVASLAGVSIDYYKRLERGNLSGVSDRVLDVLARALQLDDAERSHLFDLARGASPRPRGAGAAQKPRIRPAVQRILDQLGTPAIVRSAPPRLRRRQPARPRALRTDLREPRTAAQQRPVHVPRPGRPDFYPDWEQPASELVAHLRSEAGRNPYDRDLTDLVGELSTRSDEFRTRWAAHNVRFHRTGTKRLHHPVVGDLELSYEAMELSTDSGLTFVRLHGRGRQRVPAGTRPPRELDGHAQQHRQVIRRSFNAGWTAGPGLTAFAASPAVGGGQRR